MRRVGMVGVGGMGLALVEALVENHYPVRCHDLRPEAVAAAVELGAVAAGSARDVAAHSDVVLTFLPGPAQVVRVALDPYDGVLAGLAPGRALLDLSTCSPDVADVVGRAFDAAGRRFVDCPVSRKAPDSTILVGGVPGVLADDHEVLERTSRTLVHCGRRGAGYATKLLNQHVKYAWYLASAEALAVARSMGLDVAAVVSGIEQSSGSDSGFSTAAKYFLGDAAGMRAHAPSSTIEKDLVLAESMSTAAGVRARSLGVAVDFFLTVGTTAFRDRPYPESSELLDALRAMPAHIEGHSDNDGDE